MSVSSGPPANCIVDRSRTVVPSSRSKSVPNPQSLIDKIKALPSELSMRSGVLDFIASRAQDARWLGLLPASAAVANNWSNPEDDVYDEL